MSPRQKRQRPSAEGLLNSPATATPQSATGKVKMRLRSAPAAGPALSRGQKQAFAATQPSPATSSEPVTVPSAEEMSDEIFFKHFNARHLPDVLNLVPIRYSPTLSDGLARAFRAWHRRCHMLNDRYEHFHLED